MTVNLSRIVSGLAKWGLLFAAVLFPQIVPATSAPAHTLPELFPSLTDLPEAQTLAIQLGWQGLSLLSPIKANYLLELHDDRFEGKGRFKVATASTTRNIVVPRDLVRAFLAAATKVKLTEKEYQPRITHTDDYPSVAVIVQTKQGELTIATQSQPQKSTSGRYWDATPWAIRYSGRAFVVTDSDLDQALDPLWTRLQYDQVTGELAKEIKLPQDQGR